MDIRLGVWLRLFLLLADDLPSDDKLAHIVLLLEVEESADLGRALGAEALGEGLVGEAGDLLLACYTPSQRPRATSTTTCTTGTDA